MRAFQLEDPPRGDADQAGGRQVPREQVSWRAAYRRSSQRYFAPRMQQVCRLRIEGLCRGRLGPVRVGLLDWPAGVVHLDAHQGVGGLERVSAWRLAPDA